MAHQRDPGDRRRSQNYIRNDDGRWGMRTFLGALALLAILGFLVFAYSGDQTGDPVTPRSPGATAPTTAPSTTPPATTPKQP
jgi:hypothetical protein